MNVLVRDTGIVHGHTPTTMTHAATRCIQLYWPVALTFSTDPEVWWPTRTSRDNLPGSDVQWTQAPVTCLRCLAGARGVFGDDPTEATT